MWSLLLNRLTRPPSRRTLAICLVAVLVFVGVLPRHPMVFVYLLEPELLVGAVSFAVYFLRAHGADARSRLWRQCDVLGRGLAAYLIARSVRPEASRPVGFCIAAAAHRGRSLHRSALFV